MADPGFFHLYVSGEFTSLPGWPHGYLDHLAHLTDFFFAQMSESVGYFGVLYIRRA